MTTLIRAEIAQLHTLRSTYVFAAAIMLLTAGITVLSLGDAGTVGMTTVEHLREPVLVACGLLAPIMFACFGVAHAAGEYAHQTIDQRLLATPRRRDVLGAKLVVHGSLSGALSTAAVAVCLCIAQPMADAKGLTLDLSAASVMSLVGMVTLAGQAFAMLGVAAGFLLRSASAGMVAVFGAFIAEKLIGLASEQASSYLPYALVSSLLDVGGPTAPALAGLLLMATTLALVAAAMILLGRRDVT